MTRFPNLSHWAVTHRPMMLFLLIAVIGSGLFSFLNLGRLEDPNFRVPTMTAVIAWPGASAQEVQDEVLNPIEKKLQELDHFEYVRTFSRQGYGALTLWLEGGTPKLDQEVAWYQARKRIADLRGQLPVGVVGPVINDEYSDVYSLLWVVQGEGFSFADLNRQAEQIKRQLLEVPMVAKVDVLGKQPEKVYVEISHRKLAALGIPINAVFDAMSRQNALAPAGSVETQGDRVLLRTSGAFRSLDDIRAVPLEAQGQLLRVGDIAEVRHGYEDPAQYTIRHNGAPALAIGVTMTRDGNILTLGTRLQQRMAAIEATLPAGLELKLIADQPRVVDESVWEFERSFLEALVIVLAVCFVSLGWRAGLVVSTSVPVVLAAVACVMYLAGWNLDRISLGSLIIALGLLVDDAIIAIEMMIVKLEAGFDRLQAASYAWTSTAFQMLTGTLLKVAGVMQVGFADSSCGEGACGIFWVVGVALIVSWFVAVLVVPYLGLKLLPSSYIEKLKSKHAAQHANRSHSGTGAGTGEDVGASHGASDLYQSPMYVRLRRAIAWAVERRYAVIGATLGALLLAGAGMTLVQQQFFPTASRPELMVELRMKEGSSFDATQAESRKLEKILSEDPDVKYYTSYTGAGAPRFYLSLSPELPNPGYSQFVVMTGGVEPRERLRKRLMDRFATDADFPAARVRVTRLEFGPPAGYPVQFRVIGPDALEVRRIAEQIRSRLAGNPMLHDLQFDWNEMTRSVRLRIDYEKARMDGLAPADVAGAVQTVFSGAPVTQIRDREELIDVVVRAPEAERNRLDDLGSIALNTPNGAVPLSQIARLSYELEEPVLWRRNRAMALTVRADVVDGVQGPAAMARLRSAIQPVIDALPPGYRIEEGGPIEESAKSNRALFAVFPAMFLVMLALLMIQLQHFGRMAMVFMTAPLGLIGVVPALLLFNAPFGFVALLGVIALGGMIMRNSLILVNQIEQDIAAGHTPWQAIIDATVRRARPVVLTAAAAVLAMIPLTQSVFWGPMAMAIMGGLIVATVLTLLFVPALYAAWFRVRRDVAIVTTAKAELPLAIQAL
jgi:multidrug efflux pump subunit AcrB